MTSTPQLVTDGLWRCLCPTFRAATILRVPCRSIRALSTPALKSQVASTSRRAQHSLAQVARERNEELQKYLGLSPRDFQPGKKRQRSSPSDLEPTFPPDLNAAYEELHLHAQAGNTEKVLRIVEHLVAVLREKPNLRMYAGLIESHTNAQSGSAGFVRRYLDEMHAEGLVPDTTICHEVLKVLSVHPDYILRNEIVEYMEQRWFTISTTGHHHIVAGLLRERQLELALDKLERMRNEGITVEEWLPDLAMYVLLESGEIDEALRLARHRWYVEKGDLSETLRFHLLERASVALHHEATQLLWNRLVKSRYVNPSDGLCMNVLITASRKGDIALATDVFRVLGEHGVVFETHHYETLAETYLKAGDLRTAFSVICIAQAAGIALDESSTVPFYQHLRRDPAAPGEALAVLQSLKEEGQTIPVEAVNSVIAASAYLGNLDHAIEQYGTIHSLCSKGPNVKTFNNLLSGCRDTQRKDLAMFLAAEMLALGLNPNALTYERIMEVCIKVHDLDDALTYLDEMEAQNMIPRQGTATALLNLLQSSKDSRHPRVKEQLRRMGADMQQVYFRNRTRPSIKRPLQDRI